MPHLHAMTPTEQACVLEARVVLGRFVNRNPVISDWQTLRDYCTVVFAGARVEELHVLYLDTRNRLIADIRHGSGTTNHVPVYPREIIRTALECDAQALILAHNHPSGDPSPSQNDIALTRQVVEAARLFDLVVHDHLVVAGPAHHSLRASNEEIFR